MPSDDELTAAEAAYVSGRVTDRAARGVVDATADADLRGLRATGTATVRITADRRIDLIEVDATAVPMGPRISGQQLKLTAKAEKPAPAGDEAYAAAFTLVRNGNAEPLLKTSAQFLSAAREITGTWEIAVRSEQLASLLAGLGLPELAASGTGKFSLKPDTQAVAASGNLTIDGAAHRLPEPATRINHGRRTRPDL